MATEGAVRTAIPTVSCVDRALGQAPVVTTASERAWRIGGTSFEAERELVRLLRQLVRTQHPVGSGEEWYRGRSLAATCLIGQ